MTLNRSCTVSIFLKTNFEWKELPKKLILQMIYCPFERFLKNILGLIWLFIRCKTKSKKKSFFEKIFLFFTKYTLFTEKNLFMWKKSYIEKFFTEKNFFYREKYKWKCKKYISFQKYIFTQKMFVLEIRYKSFLKIYSFCKKKFFWW